MKIKKIKKTSSDNNIVLVCNINSELKKIYNFSELEIKFILKQIKDKQEFIHINKIVNQIFIAVTNEKDNLFKQQEKLRKSAQKIINILISYNQKKFVIHNSTINSKLSLSILEGSLLSLYKFTKYLTKGKDNKKITEIEIIDKNITQSDLEEIKNLIDGVNISRDLINEPFSYLNTIKFSEEIKKIADEAKFSCEILNKKQILSLKMGGLIAVNLASNYPPFFSILEWKPDNAKNKKPYIVVGKGIVYDTGGLSLKTTTNSMDSMKSDMAGAAAVLGLFYSIAKNKIPIHIIGLIPATDNSCNNNSIAPGDIIYMHDGTSVEVMNTDAEGRLILADALIYAKKYKPEITLDLATLTGAAHRAIGELGIVAMGNVKKSIFDKLKQSGDNTYERIVEFPLWDEYYEMIKSKIADLKNIGGSEAGAITAGKFLEHFVDYPWIHLDIAPTAFLPGNKDYRGDGATGVGIRLLYDFFKSY